MAGSEVPGYLIDAAVFLGAATLTVPLFARLRLGAVLGYLAAGVAIGPYVLGLVGNPETVYKISEFGVVLLLFVIGLELAPSRLWALRKAILGLGLSQVVLTALLVLPLAMLVLDLSAVSAAIIGGALALSSTAFALQLLKERGALNTPSGETALAVLLFQDLAIIPMLAALAVLVPTMADDGPSGLTGLAIAVAAISAVVLVGRYGLTPVFRLIAKSGGREVFVGAALLVVIGAALAMAMLGLSMALGAFLAGVALAESEFRHELEADIEPFRGLMLGLFFIAVGLGIDLRVIKENWLLLVLAAPALMLLKGTVLYGLARLFGNPHRDALEIALVLPQAGEFGFVLLASATAGGLLSAADASLMTALVALSMAATPLAALGGDALARRFARPEVTDDLEAPRREQAAVIVAGFGRVGQIVSQMLIARGLGVTMIDTTPSRIRAARDFGAHVFYGNGLRVDVLRAAGAETARMVILCTDKDEVTAEAVGAIRRAFPHLAVLVRAHDRQHMMALSTAEVDFMIRETFESSVVLGREALLRLGVAESTVESIEDEFRLRDSERLAMQISEDNLLAGSDLAYAAPFDIGPVDEPEAQTPR